MSTFLSTDFTLGTGVRVTPITVTTTPTSLDDLLAVAVPAAGDQPARESMAGRRSLTLRNTDGTSPFYILESTTQTVTDGWNVDANDDIEFEAAKSGTENNVTIEDGGGGFYLATQSGTVIVKVLEVK